MGAASKNFTAEVAACTALGEADLYVWTVLIAQQLATLRNFLGTLTYYLVQEKLYVSTRHRPSNCSESRNVIRRAFCIYAITGGTAGTSRACARRLGRAVVRSRSPRHGCDGCGRRTCEREGCGWGHDAWPSRCP